MIIYSVVYEYNDYDSYQYKILASFLDKSLADNYRNLLTAKLQADTHAAEKWTQALEAYLCERNVGYAQQRAGIEYWDDRNKHTKEYINIHGSHPKIEFDINNGQFIVEEFKIMTSIPDKYLGYI